MILSWGKPPRKMPAEEWRDISADNAPPGVYVPNMSDEDAQKWRAKHVKGKDPRVEIRKVVTGADPDGRGTYAQILIVVRPVGIVRMSANGPMTFHEVEWAELFQAVAEAREKLQEGSG